MLRTKVAIWVVVGIPVCFAGALALMPLVGVTINSMSVFGFIIVLGVVVDDAIVTGENIYTHFTRTLRAIFNLNMPHKRTLLINVLYFSVLISGSTKFVPT